MSVRFAVDRRALSLVATLVCCLLVGAFASAPAMAKTVYLLSASFSGSGASALSNPEGVAVSNATGDVYVVDTGHNRVEEIDSTGSTVLGEFNGAAAPTGAFSDPEEIAVDNSTNPLDPSAGDVYVVDNGHRVIDKFTASGTYLGQIASGEGGAPLGNLDGVAVDPNGEVWVYQENADGQGELLSYSDTLVNEFVAAHKSLAFGKPENGSGGGLAVDAQDDLYVIHYSNYSTLAKLNSQGEILDGFEEFGGEGQVRSVAVDPTSGTVYRSGEVYEGGEKYGTLVQVFDADGSLIERVKCGCTSVDSGVAVNYSSGDAASGNLYVTDFLRDKLIVFKRAEVAEAMTGAVSGFPATTSATFTGTVNPEGIAPVTGCEFEYGTQPGVFPDEVECSPNPPLNGSQSIAVSATASGLTQGQTYYYRLSATNTNGTYPGVEHKFLQPYTAKIEGESSSFDEAESVTLEAEINPGGAEASYYFEYGPAAGVYDVSVPIPARSIAASLTGVGVSARVTGLDSGTTYHYRVVVSNGLPGAVDGSDQTFTTLTPQGTGSPASCPNEQRRSEQPYGLQLPDCRAYEQVSPTDKEGGRVEEEIGRAAASGEAVMYYSPNSFDEPVGAEFKNAYLSRRGADGWSTRSITPPFALTTEPKITTPFEALVFTPELTEGTTTDADSKFSTEIPAGYNDLYLVDFAENSYRTVTNAVPAGVKPYPGDLRWFPHIGGASIDLSHIAFYEEGALTPGTSPNGDHVYVWVEGKLYQVDVPPAGTMFGGGLGGGIDGWHAVSENGRRIVFGGSNGQLYVRENPEQPPYDGNECSASADACTVEVSASQRSVADPHGPQSAAFRGASADGSRVFFTSNAELTNEANTGEEDNAANLYEYNLETGKLTDLTVDSEPDGKEKGAQVDGVADISEDGSYVYFVAEGRLASNENSHHDTAESGKPNLYLYHDGTVTFIATLSPNDYILRYMGEESFYSSISPDGKYLAFMSERRLLAYDNQPANPTNSGCGSEGCDEVYMFDATTGSLVCASCDPSGAAPLAGADLYTFKGSNSSSYAPRNLSENGERLFFDSRDPLVPQDTDGLQDVYEYEHGHVYLISSGIGTGESTFIDASDNGDDAFFVTSDGLVPQDVDQRGDMYDARVDGGFPVLAPVPSCNNADSCHGPEAPQPGVFGSPSSATFSGPGNLAPPLPPTVKSAKKTSKCAKGFVKSEKGRCVKRKKKAKHAKKSSHGKGSK